MKLKVGNFLIKRNGNGNDTEIAIVTSIDDKYTHMSVICSSPARQYSSVWKSAEVDEEGWKKFNADAWYALGQIS